MRVEQIFLSPHVKQSMIISNKLVNGTPNYQHILILFTSQPCRYKVIQSNLLLTPLYIHKLQSISDKLRPLSSSHGQLRELVFLFSQRGSHFLKRHTRLFVEPHGQSDLSFSIF